MTVIIDLASLRTAVRDRLARSDLDDQVINGHVRLVETEIRRSLPIMGLELEADYQISSPTQDLPVNLETVRYIRTTGDSGCDLKPKTENQMERYRNRDSGAPVVYRLFGNLVGPTRIEFLPAPSGVFESRLGYRVRAELANDSDSNSVLADHPDIYLNGCLHYGKMHFEDYEGADRYWAMFTRAIDIAATDDIMNQFGDGPLTPTASYVEGSVRR